MRFDTKRRAAAVIASVVLLSMLSACGGDSDASGEKNENFEVFAMAPLSGAIAAPGEQVKAGLEAAVEVINDNGGIDGRQIELTIKDDAGDPTQVAALMQEVLQSETRPDVVLAGLTSSEAVAALPLLNQEDILGTGPAGSTEMEQFDRFISATPTSVDAAKATLQAVADSGAEKVAVLVVDNVSGISAAADFEEHAAEYGLEITGSEKIAATATDASAQLERLRGDDPDVLLYSGFSPVAGAVLKSKFRIGWDIPTYADHTIGAFPYTTLASEEERAEFNVVLPSYVVQGSELQQSEAIATAIEAIEGAYGKDFDAPIQAALHTYMSLVLVKYAYEAADSTDPEDVWDARTELKAAEMPLYAGSSALFDDDAINWPTFPADDWTTVVADRFEHGFVVPVD